MTGHLLDRHASPGARGPGRSAGPRGSFRRHGEDERGARGAGRSLGPPEGKSIGRERPFFRKPGEQGGASGGASPARGVETGTGDEGKGAIVCAACGHRLARADARIAVAGTHRHTFMNPGGYVFEIGCFRDAPGTAGAGVPSAEWSWFPGHVWQIALCRGCRAHVGWSFTGDGGRFFGLVLERIGESEE